MVPPGNYHDPAGGIRLPPTPSLRSGASVKG